MVDREERDTIARCHHRKADEKALFDEEFTEWYNAARQFVSSESTRVSTPGVVSPEAPRRTPPELPHEILRETLLYVPSRTSLEFPREAPRETPENIPLRTSAGLQGETPPMTPRDVPGDTLHTRLSQRRPGPSVNGHSVYGSRRSSSGKSSKARLVVAQLKLKKIEEECYEKLLRDIEGSRYANSV